MALAHPAWLWLLLAIPALWVWPRPLRDPRHGALRSLVFALLLLGLAGPTTGSDTDREHHVLLTDFSRSVDVSELGDVLLESHTFRRRLDDARTVLVTVGAPNNVSWENSPWDESIRLAAGNSPLGGALAVAGAAIPDGARGSVTLVSDGHATAGDWGGAVQALVARGLPVHVVPLAGPPEDDLRPVGLVVEEPVRAGASARAHVDLVGRGVATVTLSGPEGALAEATDVPVDGRARVALSFEPSEPGFLPLTLEVRRTDGVDADSSDNSLVTEIAVQDPLRVLYLGERVVEGRARLEELLGRGFSFESRGAIGETTPDLDGFDLVMLDDRPADSVPESFQEEIADAVRTRGLGLVMAGGGGSFGPGGYHESPLADVLPVEFVQKEEKKDPSTALAIIIDTSGSMSGNRIVLAKEVARLAIRRLLPHDKVGIVEFYGTKRWAAPLQSAANAIEIQRALNRLDAGGGTILYPAIEEAYYGLRNAQTRYKHVLMLTDAGVETGAYETLLRRMARDGINVSTVLVGPARHGEFLVQLADWGNGRYYNASDRFNLPEIMLKQPSTARLPAYRPGTHRLDPRGGEGWWGDVDPSTVPAVSGYVESRARTGAEIVLRTREEGHPVLASWSTGLGRATALMTEPVGPGTEGWQEWPGYGAFLARVLARTASEGLGPYRFRLEPDGTRLDVIAERREAGAGAPTASRIVDRGSDRDSDPALVFVERAPGVFVASLERDPAEAVRIAAGTEGRPRHSVRLVSPANDGIAPERQVDPARALSLPALASATGGAIVPAAEFGAFTATAGGPATARDVSEWASLCFLLALLAFLSEIAYRRSRFHPGMEATS